MAAECYSKNTNRRLAIPALAGLLVQLLIGKTSADFLLQLTYF